MAPSAEHPRPLKRTECDRLVALGAFDDERIELLQPREPEPDRLRV